MASNMSNTDTSSCINEKVSFLIKMTLIALNFVLIIVFGCSYLRVVN